MENKLAMAYEAATILHDDILHLESLLDKLDPDSPEAESKERVINVKWRLYSEQRDIIDHLEDKQAIASAQAIFAYHEENDTLDLY